jgi:hypothetical protein
MDRIAASLQSDLEDAVDVQVRSRPGAGERPGFIRLGNVQRLDIVRGVHGDGLDPKLSSSASDPDRDLAPVGDQNSGRSDQVVTSLRARLWW